MPSSHNFEKSLPPQIPSSFYAHILRGITQFLDPVCRESLTSSILQQALQQLDPGREGCELTLVHCMPPRADGKIYSLQTEIGALSWRHGFARKHVFFGAESLVGRACLKGCWIHNHAGEVACPLMRAGEIAGGIWVTSPFCMQPRHLHLIDDYSNLLILASDFYRAEQLHLQMMPPLSVQLPIIQRSYRRIGALLREAAQQEEMMSRAVAEAIVWQQTEEQLLCTANSLVSFE